MTLVVSRPSKPYRAGSSPAARSNCRSPLGSGACLPSKMVRVRLSSPAQRPDPMARLPVCKIGCEGPIPSRVSNSLAVAPRSRLLSARLVVQFHGGRPHCPVLLMAQESRLSREQYGFDSRTGRYTPPLVAPAPTLRTLVGRFNSFWGYHSLPSSGPGLDAPNVDRMVQLHHGRLVRCWRAARLRLITPATTFNS